MNFTSLLKELLDTLADTFNTGNFSDLNKLVRSDVFFRAEAVASGEIQFPKLLFNNKKDLFDFWKILMTNYEYKISRVEIINVDKISNVVCHYEGLNIKMDTEIHFDEYGRVLKFDNTNIELL